MTVTALVCGSCGTGLPPNAKFCNECAAAIATATTRVEYKQVTVLFADAVHSMDLAAAVGPRHGRTTETQSAKETPIPKRGDRVVGWMPNSKTGNPVGSISTTWGSTSSIAWRAVGRDCF